METSGELPLEDERAPHTEDPAVPDRIAEATAFDPKIAAIGELASGDELVIESVIAELGEGDELGGTDPVAAAELSDEVRNDAEEGSAATALADTEYDQRATIAAFIGDPVGGDPSEKAKHITVSVDPLRNYLRTIKDISVLTAEEEVILAKDIEAGLFAEERLADPNQRLAADLRADLERLADIGKAANNRLIESNLGLVISIAKKYAFVGMPLLDLIQEGNLGLIRAVEKFDYTKGYKFSTYAVWWIRMAVTRSLAEKLRVIALPVHVVQELGRFSGARRQLTMTLSRDPTSEELAVQLDTTPERVAELRLLEKFPISLSEKVNKDDDTELADVLQDVDEPSVDELIAQDMVSDRITLLLSPLNDQERQVMLLRFGFVDGHQWTYDKIGNAIGMNRTAARNIEQVAEAKLRHPSRRIFPRQLE